MSGRDIIIGAFDGGTFGGYLAMPETGPTPGILLIQEIFGVNKFMRNVADRLAGQGYAVLCPDLFWRQEPNVQLTDQSQPEWDRAFALMQGFDLDLGIADLIATLDHLRAREGCTGKVGAVGYCLGGQLAYLMSARSAADATVGYYGVYIQDYLGEAGKISRPLMLHIAGQDQFVPPEAQDAIVKALAGNAAITLHKYPDMDHAFARPGGAHYDPQNAELANLRTLEFFAKHLA